MKNKRIGYFPEAPPEHLHPQLLSVEHQGLLYKLQLETFHLYENAAFAVNPSEHNHDVFHIVLYRAGDNVFKLDGRKRESHAGTLVLVFPGVPHCFTPMRNQESIYHEITFSLACQGQKLTIPFAELFNKYYGYPIKTNKMLIDLDIDSAAQFEDIYFELNDDLSKYNSECLFPVYQTLGRMFDLLFEKVFFLKDKYLKPHIESRLQKARSRIEQNLGDKLSLKELSLTAAMSPEHFCREFKKVYNEPPLEMRNRLRINAAMKLIKYSDCPIKQIAEELGYSDIYHFSKAFKKQTNLSPRKYRNNT